MLAVRKRNILVVFLTMILFVLSASPSSFARQRYREHRTYYVHRHSKTKGALVGGAAGLGIGALAGGRKGALIGGAVGAGSGALVQHLRNRRHRY